MEVVINESNFEEYLSKPELLILDFWAVWCGPCRGLAPILSEVAKAYEGKVIVGKVDVDECEDLAEKYSIRNVPTLLFIRNGEVVGKQVGGVSKNDLSSKIDELL